MMIKLIYISASGQYPEPEMEDTKYVKTMQLSVTVLHNVDIEIFSFC